MRNTILGQVHEHVVGDEEARSYPNIIWQERINVRRQLKKGKVVVGVCISVNGISRRRGSVLNSNVIVKVAEYVWLLTPAISKSRSLETIMNKGV